MDDTTRIDQLQRRIAELEARQAPAADEAPEPRSSRRGLLKLAGATVAGAAASSLVAGNAAATNGEAVTLGQWKTATSGTRADLSGAPASGLQAFLFQAGTARDGSGLGTTAALAGVSTITSAPSGVLGWTSQAQGSGVHGQNDNPASQKAGVTGIANSANGAGVSAQNNSGIAVRASGVTGLFATGTDFGIWATGSKAALRLVGTGVPPHLRTNGHLRGEIDIDQNGDVWCCVLAGTPGTWRKIAGTTTAGQFHPIAPARVRDSRLPTAYWLQAGYTAPFSVADKIDANGAVAVPNIVPAGATAIAYNLTALGTYGQGSLSLNTGLNMSAATPVVNWSANGQTVANASVLPIDSSRQVSVTCGGTEAAAYFTLDVVGYYR